MSKRTVTGAVRVSVLVWQVCVVHIAYAFLSYSLTNNIESSEMNEMWDWGLPMTKLYCPKRNDINEKPNCLVMNVDICEQKVSSNVIRQRMSERNS